MSFDRDGVLLAVCGSNGLIRIFDFDECTAAMRRDGSRRREEHDEGQGQGQGQGQGDGQGQGQGQRPGVGDDGYWEGHDGNGAGYDTPGDR